MMKVRFTRQFDFYPPEKAGRLCLSYPPGDRIHSVRTECAEQAIAVGAAVPVEEAERKAPSLKKRKAVKHEKQEIVSGESD